MIQTFRSAALATALLATGCTYELAIVNLDDYEVPTRIGQDEDARNIAIRPYEGRRNGLFYFNTIVDRLNHDNASGRVKTDYVGSAYSDFVPDVVLTLRPRVSYDSSAWNFLINWPGFLIFTPAWNGYVYYAEIKTDVLAQDGEGRLLMDDTIKVTYSIRHAEFDRTILTGLTWFEVSALAFFGGIYNAFNFDEDIVNTLTWDLKSNYGRFIADQIRARLRAAGHQR